MRRVMWDRTGTKLIFQADTHGNEKLQLFEISLDGGDAGRLTHVDMATHIAALGEPVSPDGRRLAYVANDLEPGAPDVLIHDRESGNTVRVGAGGGRIQAGFWSPDGERLTAVEWRENNTDHVVYLVPADCGELVRLTPDTGEPATYWIGTGTSKRQRCRQTARP